MADNTLTEVGASLVISAQDVDQYFNALVNDILPRDDTGAVVDAAGNLGSPTAAFDKLYVRSNVYVNDLPIGGAGSSGALVDNSNYIVSCSVQAVGNTPNFVDVSGTTNTVTILATTTPLEVVIGGAAITFAADVSITGLTSAPAANNTCLVNEPSMTGITQTKYMRTVNIDTIGTEISNRNGQICGFLQNSEYFLAQIDTDNSQLKILRRGAFLDSADTKIVRATIADNATITIMSTAWIFAENTGTSCVVTYKSPIYSGTEPASPATNDYYYNIFEKAWYVYSGSAWTATDRHLIGVALINSAGVALAGLAFNPRIDAITLNTIKVRKVSATKVATTKANNDVTVYGQYFKFGAPLAWDITINLDTGLTEAASTMYYLYLTHEGKPIISDEFPEYREDLLGYYHPYKTYLWCGSVRNDGSSNFRKETNNAASAGIQSQEKDLVCEINIASGDADIQIFDLNNLYKNIEVDFNDVYAANGAFGTIRATLSIDNGTNYITASNPYEFNSGGVSSGGTTYMQICYIYDFASTGVVFPTVNIQCILKSFTRLLPKFIKTISNYGVMPVLGGGGEALLTGFGSITGSNSSLYDNPINAMKFVNSGGNFGGGVIRVYGYKNRDLL